MDATAPEMSSRLFSFNISGLSLFSSFLKNERSRLANCLLVPLFSPIFCVMLHRGLSFVSGEIPAILQFLFRRVVRAESEAPYGEISVRTGLRKIKP